MKQHIIFDLDDTLYLEKDFVKSGFKAVDRHLIKTFKIYGFYDKAWKRFTDGENKYIFDNVLIDLKCQDDVNPIKELVKIYREHKPNIKLLDDSKWALKYYSSLNPISLLSDGYLQSQQNKVESLRVESFFEKIYFTDYWGRQFWKPNLFVFKELQKDFSKTFNDFVYISDNPLKDFIATNELGWKSICIKREFGIYNEVDVPSNGKPNIIINSLYELENLLPL